MVDKYLNRISKILELLTVIIFIILVLVILMQMISRYLSISKTGWTDEIISFATTWMVFLGTSYLVQRGEHISVTLLEDSLSGFRKNLLRVIIHISNILCGIGLLYSGYVWVLNTANKKTPYLQISYNLWYSAIFVFGVFFTLFSIFKCLMSLRILFDKSVD